MTSFDVTPSTMEHSPSRSDYESFLRKKFDFHKDYGFAVNRSDLSPILLPHQADIVEWALLGGRRAIFASFGLGKSVMQLEILRLIHEREKGRCLIVCPLGVKQEFTRDARELLGIDVTFVRWSADVEEQGPGIYLTNYESIRDGRLNPDLFDAVSLDEASVLRSYGSKTYQTFLGLFHDTKYRFVATATPSPNRYKELIHYAGFLGVMDTGQALTRFFQRDSTQANNLTLYAHKVEEFFVWLHSWAIFLQRPSDLGYSDAGYDLPELDVQWHEMPALEGNGIPDRDGQGRIFRDTALGVSAAAREKRDTLPQRLTQMLELLDGYFRQAGIQPGLLRGESGTAARCTEGAGTAELPVGPEEVRRAGEAMAGSEPGEVQSVDQAARREERREDEGQEPGVVSGQHGPSGDHCQAKQATPVRSDTGAVPGDDGGANGIVPDLRTGDEAARRRSRSRNGSGAGAALSPVQLCVRSVRGRSDPVDESGRVSDQIVIWCDLNIEQRAIEAALNERGLSYSSIDGSLDTDEVERRINDWRDRRTYALIGKPVMLGQGLNLQQCNKAIFIGVTFKFNSLIQAIHRIQRFGQTRACEVHLIYAESEREVVKTLRRKWAQHEELTKQMSAVIRKHGLDQVSIVKALERSLGVERVEMSGEGWILANNDCVEETRGMDECSVDEIVTSIPFAFQYEYTPSYNDFGHTDSNEHFWAQMGFLTPELYRSLRPGRIYACHVKDRINFGNVTGKGYSTVSPFHAEAIMHNIGHGFEYMGMITVVTDVVRENNQSYRLGWTEQCKDATKMGVGSPEYVLIFRKPQTDRTKGYADVPVVHDKEQYSRARWQVDAHAFWRSDGDRPLTSEDMRGLSTSQRMKLFEAWTLNNVYDHELHIAIGEACDGVGGMGVLPSTFMLLAPGSPHPEVWHDVNRMRTLNGDQVRRGLAMHVCLARGSLVLTRGGYKPIQEVAIGEHVLTHKGRWRPVLARENTGVREVVQVKAQGVSGLFVTPDHKLWTRPVRDIPWARSHSRREAIKTYPTWVPASETVGSYVNLKLPPVENPAIMDPRYWWTVGRWLADGHIDKRGVAHICCGRHEVDALVSTLGEYGGNPPRDTGTALDIALRDPGHELRRTLKSCGAGAAGKHLPPEAYTLPFIQARALLDGYLSGDGHYVIDRDRWTASSVSRELLLGVAMLAQRAYAAVASIYPGRSAGSAVIQGRAVATKDEWVLCFDVPNEDRRKGNPLILDDGAWKKVRSAEPVGVAETWNLRVAEDESYTAEGCVVKNCPLQFDIVDRLIERYSNPGDLVYDPFAGLGTVPMRALRMGRQGRGAELNPQYFADSVRYLQAEEMRVSTPSLFDLIEMEAVPT